MNNPLEEKMAMVSTILSQLQEDLAPMDAECLIAYRMTCDMWGKFRSLVNTDVYLVCDVDEDMDWGVGNE